MVWARARSRARVGGFSFVELAPQAMNFAEAVNGLAPTPGRDISSVQAASASCSASGHLAPQLHDLGAIEQALPPVTHQALLLRAPAREL